MNSGIPQICMISSESSYSLLSFNQQLLQSHSLHSHVQSEKRPINLDESKRQAFIQGLDSKRVALDHENTFLQKEHQVLTTLMQDTMLSTNVLKPFITNHNVEEISTKQSDIDFQMKLHVEESSVILRVDTEQALEIVGFLPNEHFCLPSRLSKSSRLFWLSKKVLSSPFFLVFFIKDKSQIIKRVDIQKVKKSDCGWNDFPRFLFSNQTHLSFDGYLTATVQYRLLFSRINDWMNGVSLLQNGRLDMISPHSTYTLMYLLKRKLIEEIAFLREEINVSLIFDYFSIEY